MIKSHKSNIILNNSCRIGQKLFISPIINSKSQQKVQYNERVLLKRIYNQMTEHKSQLKKSVLEHFGSMKFKQFYRHTYDLNQIDVDQNDFQGLVSQILQNQTKYSQGEVAIDLYMCYNKLGDDGCRLICKIPHVRWLFLDSNLIGPDGCYYLSKANWPYLNDAYMGYNMLGDKGCQNLSKASWKYLQKLYLYQNQIGYEGCYHLVKPQWKNLKVLILFQNNIQNQGCKALSRNQWSNLQQFDLGSNAIEDKGCHYLAKANWPQLRLLNIYQNEFGNRGCQFLSKSFSNLFELDLKRNHITEQGCRNLSKAVFKQMKRIDIRVNNITLVGSNYLKGKSKIMVWDGKNS